MYSTGTKNFSSGARFGLLVGCRDRVQCPGPLRTPTCKPLLKTHHNQVTGSIDLHLHFDMTHTPKHNPLHCYQPRLFITAILRLDLSKIWEGRQNIVGGKLWP